MEIPVWAPGFEVVPSTKSALQQLFTATETKPGMSALLEDTSTIIGKGGESIFSA